MLVMAAQHDGDGQTYAFDNALAVQRERLETLETLFDPGTIRQL
jgi:hypothetical protein